ncbi:hypothetical protein M3Y98_00451900 [Aphelenchoides besseyi]|nr:hypothetical protein M3Y98_00451900 [Aphelenchoides besseyi]
MFAVYSEDNFRSDSTRATFLPQQSLHATSSMDIRSLRVLWFFGSLYSTINAVRCYYCASSSTKIAPQLWLHSEPCRQRRLTTCPSAQQSCVVVRVSHDRINFTVAGCAEDDYVGCEQFVQLASHGPTAVHLCQCRDGDRCNSDFHLDFGSGLGRFRSNSTPKTLQLKGNELPSLKKVHPVALNAKSAKTERAMPCADEKCSEPTTSGLQSFVSLNFLLPFTCCFFLTLT